MKPINIKLFGGEGSEAQNALMQALINCAADEDSIYGYLSSTPKTSLVVEICDALKELGYDIRLTNPN